MRRRWASTVCTLITSIAATSRLVRPDATRRAPSGPELTPAEEQVARLVASGRTLREVAAMLVMRVLTVDAHLRRIYRNLQVRSLTELAHKLFIVRERVMCRKCSYL